jgi:hypothetical protein
VVKFTGNDRANPQRERARSGAGRGARRLPVGAARWPRRAHRHRAGHHPDRQRGRPAAGTLPEFEKHEYQQILHDVRYNLAPQLGWTPAPAEAG